MLCCSRYPSLSLLVKSPDNRRIHIPAFDRKQALHGLWSLEIDQLNEMIIWYFDIITSATHYFATGEWKIKPDTSAPNTTISVAAIKQCFYTIVSTVNIIINNIIWPLVGTQRFVCNNQKGEELSGFFFLLYCFSFVCITKLLRDFCVKSRDISWYYISTYVLTT